MREAQVNMQVNCLSLSGGLDYTSGPQLREQGGRLLRGLAGEQLQIDCQAVSKSSSVGLALLLAFMRDAQAQGKTVRIVGLPEDMRQIAEVCALDECLPLGDS